MGLLPSPAGPDPAGLFDDRADPRLAGVADAVSRATGADPSPVRAGVLRAGEDVEAALYRRSVQALGDLPGLLLGVALFAVAVFFFLKDGEAIVRG